MRQKKIGEKPKSKREKMEGWFYRHPREGTMEMVFAWFGEVFKSWEESVYDNGKKSR